MRPVHRATLLVVPAVLALSSCDIPATGVVEAGGPASGIAPTALVYYLRNGTLVAVSRKVPEAGDVTTAVAVLLDGPTPQERRKHLTTRLARQPALLSPTDMAQDATDTPTEAVAVTTRDGSVSVELPWYTAELSSLATDQVICTAARAYLLTRRDLDSVTVTVTGASGRPTEGSDDRCPDP
ncbi:hypothetical protein [Streptomyces fulvoviolaceus]|uniref:hypothetical protein n=1 Tax=Streptomyces fulvoviolaceus TaxID=285535 RepID=UPI0021BF5A8F|nr:hypothetical protein [Streptomyces fulvoviolaceus]MCT9080219.1 hypothetical protein [Streptomyces fulvoviolaceus]